MNRAHQGQAPIGTLRRKPSWIRNTKISLLHPCTGTKLQHVHALLASLMSLKPPTPLCRQGGTPGSTARWSTCLHLQTTHLHPQPTRLHARRRKRRRKGPCLGKQEPGGPRGSHPPLAGDSSRSPCVLPATITIPQRVQARRAACTPKGVKSSREGMLGGRWHSRVWAA